MIAPTDTAVPTAAPSPTPIPSPTDVPTTVPAVPPTITATVADLPTPAPTSPISPTPRPTATPIGTIAPIGVMIDNDPHARPQTGLNQADVVYEAPAEFNLTRFLAIYFANAPEVVGSIRSTRPYFAQIMAEYGGGLVHCLDVPGVTSALASGNVFNFDMCHGTGEEGAIRASNRPAPFNLYANAHLLQNELRLRLPREAAPLVARAPLPVNAAVVPRVVITYPQGHTAVWTWDGERYLRQQDGAPHLDASGDPMSTDVVVVQRAITRPTAYFGEAGYHTVQLTGSGIANIFANGQSAAVRWKRPDLNAPTTFTDDAGSAVRLPPGRVFFEVVPVESNVATE
jgi:hypothetical protein